MVARPRSVILAVTSWQPSMLFVMLFTTSLLLLMSDVTHAFNECEFYYWETIRASTLKDFTNKIIIVNNNINDKIIINNCPRRINVNSGGQNDDPNFPTIKIGWIPAPPYLIDEGSDTPTGIFPKLIDHWLRTSCSNYQYHVNRPFRYSWVKKSVTSVKDLVENCRDGGFSACSMSVPTVGVLNKDGGNGVAYRTPFAGFYKVPQVVYVTVQGEMWRNTIKNFTQSVINVWPFFALCLLFALISGSIMWVLDTWTNDHDFPRSFFPGIYHGFWWSFVSMTAVGYGDKKPLSVVGRLFSVIWIIVGISMIGILTSILSNALRGATKVPEKSIYKAKIGVLPGIDSVDNIIVDKLDGIPTMVKDIDELQNLLARGLLTGFVMDMYTFQYYYKSHLSKLAVHYVIERKFDMDNYYYGISFVKMDNTNNVNSRAPGATPENWRTCMESYVNYNYHFRDKMERFYRNEVFDKIDPSLLIPKDEKPLSLFDVNSDFFKDLLWTIALIVIAIMVIGLVFEAFRVMFFGSGAVTLSERLGLAHNAGYTADGENTEGKDADNSSKKMTREEKQIADLVDKTVRHTEEHMQSTEREVKNEIREMVRSIRRQMAEMKRRNDKDYGL